MTAVYGRPIWQADLAGRIGRRHGRPDRQDYFSSARKSNLESKFFAPISWNKCWKTSKSNFCSKFLPSKCWIVSWKYIRDPEFIPELIVQLNDQLFCSKSWSRSCHARLNARLFALENSDGKSVFRQNRLFARLFHLQKSDAKSSMKKASPGCSPPLSRA